MHLARLTPVRVTGRRAFFVEGLFDIGVGLAEAARAGLVPVAEPVIDLIGGDAVPSDSCLFHRHLSPFFEFRERRLPTSGGDSAGPPQANLPVGAG